MHYKNHHIAILGAGESGIGAAVLAQQHGNRVFVSDNQEISSNFKSELANKAIAYEEKGHTKSTLLKNDLVIKSPGIPQDAPILKAIREAGIPMMAEIEFADQFASGTKIGVTGTNGKTTTASLIYEIVKKEGWDVALAGNIGKSYSRKVAERDHDYWVLELSSFQLEDVETFHLSTATILNITPDHLNRYQNSMEAYADAKFRICLNQTGSDQLIYNADDPVIKAGMQRNKPESKLLPFSTENAVNEGAYMKNDKIIFQVRNEENPLTMNPEELTIQGKHNVQNAMAAGVVGRILNIRKKTIRESFQNFQTIEHRLEKVLEVHGIRFINDSKGSNLNSVWYALESMKKPVVWIAGGQDKGNDYESLKPVIRKKVKALVALGKDNTRLRKAFKDTVPVSETDNMKEAVQMAYEFGSKGDVVLLSPGCASFDLFKDYEDRGKQFKEAVYKL